MKPIIIIPRPADVTNRTFVHEKRAPTDESVRLLKEMEDAARSKIEQSIRLTDNAFSGLVSVWTDQMNRQLVVVVSYSLNGHRHKCTTHIDIDDAGAVKVAGAVISNLAQQIAAEILSPAFGDNQGLLGLLHRK